MKNNFGACLFFENLKILKIAKRRDRMARQIPAIFKFRPKVHRNETETKQKPGN